MDQQNDLRKLLQETNGIENALVSDPYEIDYKNLLGAFGRQYDDIAGVFHKRFPEPPFTYNDFLIFMKEDIGFTVTIIPIDAKNYVGLAGQWFWANKEKSAILICVNSTDSDEEKKITVVHECIHALQDYDYPLKSFLARYPLAFQMQVANKLAEDVAIQVFMPREKVSCDRLGGLSAYEIALKYAVPLRFANCQ